MSERTLVDPEILEKCSLYPDYVEAKLGFRNHWYPSLFSHELEEGEFKAHEILGDRLLLTRVDGKVYAVRDRCPHRGVPFSRRPECFKKGTLTCWYHAFTFKLSTGMLCDIITNPKSNLIGKVQIPTYKVEEAKGIIFIFMGDIDPPDLADDVPPGFLDENMVIRGVRQEVGSNWRIGCENGFDSTHVFIHKDSILVEGNDITLPLGFVPTSRDTFKVVDGPTGPKGVYDLLAEHCIPIFEGKIEGETVLQGHMGSNRVAYDISIWLPGVLRVDPWPDPSLTQFEWYVPIDESRHFYIQTLGRSINVPEDEAIFDEEFENKWKDLALAGFNDDDIWAREAQQEFYKHDEAWYKEQLFEPDRNISKWRQLASRHHRGIQRYENLF
ncbi:MAG: Rieske 2Fe-2S domain-containing protein [Gammaproteobacteria bacterium]|jgi:carbazole 1,9a-dioxygenase|nr:Rieske 2Fe-2S domain-containing protein [Gammaproteobacteria bacterium]